jgi:SAM-dependent methyltransferase
MNNQTPKMTPKILTRPYYERLSELEDKHPWTEAMRRMALELVSRRAAPAPTRVLDAGCGTGRFLHECGGQCEQARMFGCDLSTDGLRFATGRGLKRAAVASLTSLPFLTGSFDVVVCADVLQHLSATDADRALGQFARLLSPHGTLIIRTAARRGIGRKKHRDSGDYQQWEPEKLRAALEGHGLDIVFLSRVNWLPSILADVKVLLKPAPKGDVGLRLEPPPANHWKSRLMTSYWNTERRLILGSGWRPPGGHTLFCAARKEGLD